MVRKNSFAAKASAPIASVVIYITLCFIAVASGSGCDVEKIEEERLAKQRATKARHIVQVSKQPCQWCKHCNSHHKTVNDPIDKVYGLVCTIKDCESWKAQKSCLDYFGGIAEEKAKRVCPRCAGKKLEGKDKEGY